MLCDFIFHDPGKTWDAEKYSSVDCLHLLLPKALNTSAFASLQIKAIPHSLFFFCYTYKEAQEAAMGISLRLKYRNNTNGL